MKHLHAVSPEKVMALYDRELSEAEVKIVSQHVDDCSECARLSEELRSTSQVLSSWTVPKMSNEFEIRVRDVLAEKHSCFKLGRPSLASRFPRWARWTFATAGTVAALFFIVTSFGHGNLSMTKTKTVAYQGRPGVEAQETQGQLSPAGSEREERSTLALSQPAIAKDSNGFFSGMGDRTTRVSSMDGQPPTERASEDNSAPMIARTVSLSIMVKDFAAARTSLDALLKRDHGYSAQLSVNTPENAPRGLQGSLRVPAPELSSAVSEIKALGRVENESQSGEEVTRPHADLLSRLKTARETEQRFRAILQQRTGKVAEVLQVEEGIARVRGAIERMEGEQKALEHRVDFATIELQLTEEYKASLNPPAASVSTRIHNAFVTGYRNATDTLLGIVLFLEEYLPTLLIWMAILVVPGIILWRRYRKAMAGV